jgi:hypothetical protein
VQRPAFYALAPGGWRDLITLLHPPYTAWHLSYVALGAAAAPKVYGDRLAAALGAFFLGVGVCAHALDELTLVSLAGAVAIGVVGVITVSPSLAVFVAAGAFIVVAYNLELFGGRFHSDTWFAIAWGAFPALTSYWANALTLRGPGVGVVAGCFALSLAQRRLSTPVRELRRSTLHLSGTQTLADGSEVELDAERLAAPLDGALRALAVAILLIAAAAVWTRL